MKYFHIKDLKFFYSELLYTQFLLCTENPVLNVSFKNFRSTNQRIIQVKKDVQGIHVFFSFFFFNKSDAKV